MSESVSSQRDAVIHALGALESLSEKQLVALVDGMPEHVAEKADRVLFLIRAERTAKAELEVALRCVLAESQGEANGGS